MTLGGLVSTVQQEEGLQVLYGVCALCIYTIYDNH